MGQKLGANLGVTKSRGSPRPNFNKEGVKGTAKTGGRGSIRKAVNKSGTASRKAKVANKKMFEATAKAGVTDKAGFLKKRKNKVGR